MCYRMFTRKPLYNLGLVIHSLRCGMKRPMLHQKGTVLAAKVSQQNFEREGNSSAVNEAGEVVNCAVKSCRVFTVAY